MVRELLVMNRCFRPSDPATIQIEPPTGHFFWSIRSVASESPEHIEVSSVDATPSTSSASMVSESGESVFPAQILSARSTFEMSRGAIAALYLVIG